MPLMGVEEEYFLVDLQAGTPQPAGARVVRVARETLGDLVCGEFTQYQVEVKTPPCADAMRLREHLLWLRVGAAAAAAAEGLRIYASGTPVVAGCAPGAVGDHPRYRAGVQQYRGMLEDFAICAVHVHVHLPDAEVAVLVGNHLRPWLPLLGLAAHQGSGLIRRVGSPAECCRRAKEIDLRRWRAAPRPDQMSCDAGADRRSHRPAGRRLPRELDSAGTARPLRSPPAWAPGVCW